jgi:hypothetical protein
MGANGDAESLIIGTAPIYGVLGATHPARAQGPSARVSVVNASPSHRHRFGRRSPGRKHPNVIV